MTNASRYFIVGGAGFIGSHFTDRLLSDASVAAVTLYDNFSSGREWHYERHRNDKRLCVVRGDVKEVEALTTAMQGHDVAIHLASNPDIARAVTEPEIDFREGTFLTNNVVEAMRRSGTKMILYASVAAFTAIWA
jgi:UDP-glucose 4-epimerase